jgi:transcriptional regulator with XRE-family HTH domain
MEQRGLAQQRLASQLDVDRNSVSAWKLGTSAPTADRLPRLARELRCSQAELVLDPSVPTRPGASREADVLIRLLEILERFRPALEGAPGLLLLLAEAESVARSTTTGRVASR